MPFLDMDMPQYTQEKAGDCPTQALPSAFSALDYISARKDSVVFVFCFSELFWQKEHPHQLRIYYHILRCPLRTPHSSQKL